MIKQHGEQDDGQGKWGVPDPAGTIDDQTGGEKMPWRKNNVVLNA